MPGTIGLKNFDDTREELVELAINGENNFITVASGVREGTDGLSVVFMSGPLKIFEKHCPYMKEDDIFTEQYLQSIADDIAFVPDNSHLFDDDSTRFYADQNGPFEYE